MVNVRTDLAIEANKIYKENNNKDADGISVTEQKVDESTVTWVKVLNEDGAKKINKPMGNYITIDIPEFTVYDGELMDVVSKTLGVTLKNFMNITENDSVLVVGLGNIHVTPDALGPKTCEKIMVTRHLKEVMPEYLEQGITISSAISPGVLGITGIETVEIIESVVKRINPTVVICIDALASRSTKRVNKTIQISDTGIVPGAGVNNKRKEISEKSLGAKVISIGVPTVVHASTIASDTIDVVLDELIKQSKQGQEFYNMLKNLDKEEKDRLIHELLSPTPFDMIVTPKEIDISIECLSKIIANGINIAVQPKLKLEDINKFLN